MADTIERLYKLTVDGTQAARSLATIERNTAALDKRMADSINGIKKFGAALAGAVTVREIVQGFGRIIDSMDQLVKDSQKIGIAAEELQRLRYAAELSGVSAEELNTALTKLSQAMTRLDDKGNKAAGVLRRFGVTEADTAISAMKKFADGLAKMPEGFEKTALAADLFGKGVGTKMIPMLNAGGEAFIALTKEADKFGEVISEKTLRQAEEFNDNMTRLGRVAKTVGAQLTEGMLPTLIGITNAFKDATREGDGFVSMGAKLGAMLANTAGYAIKTGATLEAFVLTLQLIGDMATSNVFERPSIFRKYIADVNEVNDKANKMLDTLRSAVSTARIGFPEMPSLDVKEGVKGKPAKDPLEEAERRAKAAKEAEKAAREREKQQKAAADFLENQVKGEQAYTEAVQKQNAVLTDAERVAAAMVQARIDATDAAKAHAEALQIEEARLDRLVELMASSDPVISAWARAQLVATAAAQGTTTTLEKQRDELDVLNEAFNDFVDAAANSAGHLEDAIKQMVTSIIAQLLKLWAKKYILDVVAGALGVKAATGAVFDEGKVMRFARGGVIAQPFTMPMALMGEAGPEAIMPLRRAANGDLGVQATSSPLNITVNNYADATVRTRRTGPNDLEVIVEQTRKAIAADLLKGGNMVAKSLEQAYGIGRGAAAAY